MTKVQRLRNETYNEACDLLQKYGLDLLRVVNIKRFYIYILLK